MSTAPDNPTPRIGPPRRHQQNGAARKDAPRTSSEVATLTLNGRKAKVWIALMDPTLSADHLTRNLNNRPRSSRRSSSYGKRMAEGRWKLNGRPIILDADGNVLDGQHRLAGSVEGGASFYTLVVQGIEEDAYPTIDRGAIRTSAHLLTHLHDTQSVALAAAASYVHSHLAGCPEHLHVRPEADEVAALVKAHPDLHTCVTKVRGARRLKKLQSASLLAACLYLFAAQDEAKAASFFDALESGEGLTRTSPAYLLRERLQEDRAAKVKMHLVEVLALVSKAWIAYRDGKTLETLRWRSTGATPEPFPAI